MQFLDLRSLVAVSKTCKCMRALVPKELRSRFLSVLRFFLGSAYVRFANAMHDQGAFLGGSMALIYILGLAFDAWGDIGLDIYVPHGSLKVSPFRAVPASLWGTEASRYS